MKRILYLLMVFLALRAEAQVTITPQLPPAGILSKAQLWNIALMSGSQAPIGATVTLRLMDATTNQAVLTGITKEILLNRGARQLTAADFTPIQYEYLSPSVDRSPNGLLPAGNYLACYSLILSDNKQHQMGEDCIPFVVEPVSPPQLNMPENKSLVETDRPQFTWLPPTPASMFKDLNYDLVLTYVREGQSPEEAVQQNAPVYRRAYLKDVFVNYPSAAKALDTAATYAWTVRAKNGTVFAAQSEVWTFRVKGRKVINGDNNGAYVALRRELDGAVVSVSDVLAFSFINETDDTLVNYDMMDLSNNQQLEKGQLKVQLGENRLSVTFKSRMKDGALYLFTVRNSHGERWQIKVRHTEK
ncbi:hypothetical protein [Chitinophaga sp. sic0106]|uniref:hypothetical protein n=1 Tax=Chitinophaga sp. sic0106 TaxID=2854785 RepID=UPI001C45623D|nr:hypothetical protein [Chitinophaga sp. sic0106]MBV7533917.1 hypothetical protein [Chitinophaga sp. sic0106]